MTILGDSIVSKFRWKGSEGSKQAKHTTRKLTPDPGDSSFFFNLRAPLFENVCFHKVRHLFRFACATGYDMGGTRPNLHIKRLPSVLLSDANVVTKSCIARFFDNEACKPSALSDCSTGPSPPLATGARKVRPCRHPGQPPAVNGPTYSAAFAQFPNITAHRSQKIRAQCERPPFHVLYNRISCPSVQYK